jgi:hypothetical protein
MVEIVSHDLVAPVAFYRTVVESISSHADDGARAVLLRRLSSDLHKLFTTRILDAPEIQRVGRRQFCADLGFVLGLFETSPSEPTLILEEVSKIR